MRITCMTQEAETSFFRDFVDNSDLRLGKFLLTKEGQVIFNGIKFGIRQDLEWVLGSLSHERTEKLLRMAMIQHAVSQILYEIAMEEDNKTSQ